MDYYLEQLLNDWPSDVNQILDGNIRSKITQLLINYNVFVLVFLAKKITIVEFCDPTEKN